MRRNLTPRWHDIRVNRMTLLTVFVATFLTFQTPLITSASAFREFGNTTNEIAADPTTSPDTSTPGVYDLENEPGECVGFLPKPGCGKEPQDAGERGGALQYLVFAIMIAGLSIVGIGITKGVRQQRPPKK